MSLFPRDAACLGVDPEIFVPPQSEAGVVAPVLLERAAVYCRSCPVREACLAFGAGEEFGVFGGLDAAGRRELHRIAV